MRSVTEVVQIRKLVLNHQNNLEKYGSARYLFNETRTPQSKTVLDISFLFWKTKSRKLIGNLIRFARKFYTIFHRCSPKVHCKQPFLVGHVRKPNTSNNIEFLLKFAAIRPLQLISFNFTKTFSLLHLYY